MSGDILFPKGEVYLDKIAETSILFDLYGGLLTEKKRQVMELYHEEDLSLGEIAEEQGISRAAVHDALKTAEKSLRDYEDKLGMASGYMERQEILKELKKEFSQIKEDVPKTSAKKIEKLLSRLED